MRTEKQLESNEMRDTESGDYPSCSTGECNWSKEKPQSGLRHHTKLPPSREKEDQYELQSDCV